MALFTKKKMKKTEKKKSKLQIFVEYFSKYTIIALGAIIAAFALECFLLPNDIIDGGVIGISMMVSKITTWNLGVVILCINLPFLIYILMQKNGKVFVMNVLYGVSVLAIFVNIFSHNQITQAPLLATVFGGMILGLGVGLILKNGAALDGTEILAIKLSKKIGYSVGEIIMFCNFFIYTAAGTLYGWDSAMYSILTYFVAYKVIDTVLEGVNGSKSALIISNYPKEIGDAIIKELDISVTYQKGKGGYSGKEMNIIYCVINRLDIMAMKKLIREIDPEAFLVIQDVHEVEGVRVKKK
ncbi:MAG: YitT family protein [Candidatus Gastranaerophilaceae bacterium]